MMIGSNSPDQSVLIRAEARKSFSFAVWVKDHHGRLLDLTGTTLSLVAKNPLKKSSDDTDNLIVNSIAELTSPTNGYAKFSLQATDLEHAPGEYPYAIVLLDNGYSSVLAKGILEIVSNTEFTSTSSVYDPLTPVSAMAITLRGRRTIEVRAGSTLPPGTTSFLFTDKAKLDGIEPGAQAHIASNWEAGSGDPGYIQHKPILGSAAFVDIGAISVPLGGSPGEVLTKLSSSDFDTAWAQPTGGGGGGGSGLDPTGVAAGLVPTANGANGWTWLGIPAQVASVNGAIGNVSLTLADIPDAVDRSAMTDAQVTKLTDLTLTPAWTSITGRPTLGTASTRDDNYFLQPAQVNATTDITAGEVNNARLPKLSALRGFTAGTAAPSGGADGDIYFQYTV